MYRNRVVITGIGLINPLGNDKATIWNNIIKGRSKIEKLPENFWPDSVINYKYNFAGFVHSEQALLDKILSKSEQRRTERFINLAMIAGSEALADAGITIDYPKNRGKIGVVLGVGIGGIDSVIKSDKDLILHGYKKISPFLIPRSISNQASSWLSMKFNLKGHISTIVNACSSSADAIGYSFRMIRDGYLDYVVTGGTESAVTPLSIVAFGNMRALANSELISDPKKASRPFDKDRSGFVMSEGAGILVLERMDLALKRNASIYAEIIGYGATSDAYHITAMHPEAEGAARAIELALSDAKLEPKKVDYINAHGTSTVMNDKLETLALKKVFREYINPSKDGHIKISSTKSMTGHLLGAAGGTEVAFTALSLKNNILPPTINLDNIDPDCDLDYIPNETIFKDIEFAMSNSFGFGGANSSLILKKYKLNKKKR